MNRGKGRKIVEIRMLKVDGEGSLQPMNRFVLMLLAVGSWLLVIGQLSMTYERQPRLPLVTTRIVGSEMSHVLCILTKM